MSKLTKAQREVLMTLSCCTMPWDAKHGTSRIMLGKLERMGLAEMKHGYPVGWVITHAGRAALEAQS